VEVTTGEIIRPAYAELLSRTDTAVRYVTAAVVANSIPRLFIHYIQQFLTVLESAQILGEQSRGGIPVIGSEA
jgi:hypothetical protein